jgi:ATPase family associated with various cellular activities (AAA)
MAKTEKMDVTQTDVASLCQLALMGTYKEVDDYIRVLHMRYQYCQPQFARRINAIRIEAARQPPASRRGDLPPIPVDAASSIPLLEVNDLPNPAVEPVWSPAVRKSLEQVLSERNCSDQLTAAGLEPTRSILFTGPSGMGKTLTAGWLAQKLHRALLTIDLSAMMSGSLAQIRVNVRKVLDFAKNNFQVLMLDDFGGSAIRQAEDRNSGEVARFAKLLLEQVNQLPARGLLIATANHSELVDPSVSHRFQMHIDFPMPSENLIRHFIDKSLPPTETSTAWRETLAIALVGLSFAEIERELMLARRAAVLGNSAFADVIGDLMRERVAPLSRKERANIAFSLRETGLSQRKVHALTGVSRDTIRKGSK